MPLSFKAFFMGSERPAMERHGSWGDLSFVGGEEDALDFNRDKYAFERRMSNDFKSRQKEFADVVDAASNLGKMPPPVPIGGSLLYGDPAMQPRISQSVAADPWRSVFHPGRNANVGAMRSQGANVYDKPTGNNDKTVWDHTVQSEKSSSAGKAKNYWKVVRESINNP